VTAPPAGHFAPGEGPFRPEYPIRTARLLLRLGFEDLGLHRIAARCDARNTASARVMERAGLRREAHLVQSEFVKGEWTDELIYAILRSEWAAR
jgi:RimJ/RimL family protein N-acetyltransferase